MNHQIWSFKSLRFCSCMLTILLVYIFIFFRFPIVGQINHQIQRFKSLLFCFCMLVSLYVLTLLVCFFLFSDCWLVGWIIKSGVSSHYACARSKSLWFLWLHLCRENQSKHLKLFIESSHPAFVPVSAPAKFFLRLLRCINRLFFLVATNAEKSNHKI